MPIFTKRRMIRGSVVILLLLIVLWYIYKYWFVTNYLQLAQPFPSAALDVDKNFNFPPGFPPDPGSAGKMTIHGIDSDHDGVRDDVQRWIYAFVPNEPKKQMALRQNARYYQHALADDFGPEVRKTSHVLVDRTIQCRKTIFSDELHGYMEDIYVKAKVMNTYDRTLRYLENDEKHTFEEMLGETPKYKEPCDER